jgi:hypothetical protein
MQSQWRVFQAAMIPIVRAFIALAFACSSSTHLTERAGIAVQNPRRDLLRWPVMTRKLHLAAYRRMTHLSKRPALERESLF